MAGKKKEKKEKKEKPLDKWTMKELREEALKLGTIHGVHGMNKEELLVAMREAKGIAEPEKGKKTVAVREVKAKITDLRKSRDDQRAEGAARAKLNILRKKVARLKKSTRG
jgi:hypothetical protein